MIKNKLKIVLVGGGHSHAILLKLWDKNIISNNIELILISNTKKTPYSGMLPGYIAGFYTYQEVHIDLVSLAKFANATFYLDNAIGLNLEKNQVICNQNKLINFDLLSIDIGSTPSINNIIGANTFATPSKPVNQLLKTWNKLVKNAKINPNEQIIINIIGGGAGGVELALNMYSRISKIIDKNKLIINIIQKNNTLLPTHNKWVQNRLENILQSQNISVFTNTKIIEITSNQVICESGLKINSNYTFLVTQASSPQWIKNSGLTTDNQGFILTKNTLQSVSHPQIFATGDIATMAHYPRPKSGVFAVKQGKPLYHNLLKISRVEILKNYIPQEKYLNLIGTGYKTAIASYGEWGGEAPLFWYWKEYLDRQFMSYVTRNG